MSADTDADEIARLNADLRKWFSGGEVPLPERRAKMDLAESVLPLPEGISAAAWSKGELAGQWLSNDAARDGRIVLYFHGGGFCAGSSKSHRHLAAFVARAARADALIVDYRLAPEHPFPAGLNDAIGAYAAVLEQASPGRVAVVGDSAGGGMSLALLHAARAKGMPQPGALALLSPWLDLSGQPFSDHEMARADDLISSTQDMIFFSTQYASGASLTDPLVSPLYGDLNNLPPTLIQVASEELLLRDALTFVARARHTAVTLEIESGLPHVWHWYCHRLRRARTAIDRVGRFIDDRLR